MAKKKTRGGRRPGAGRPLKDGVEKAVLTANIPAKLKDKIYRISRTVKQPVSTIVTDVLEKGFKYIDEQAAKARGE